MSALAGRLSLAGGRPIRTKDSSGVMSRLQYKSPGVGQALANRLGGPNIPSGSGVKARLGAGRRTAMRDSTYELSRKRQNSRDNLLDARRKLDDISSPTMVKMAGGKMVGGMRSDVIEKSPNKKYSERSPDRRHFNSKNSAVTMDLRRGLTVKLDNKHRQANRHNGEPSASFRDRGSSSRYSQHDDRYSRGGDSDVGKPDYEERERPRLNLAQRGERRPRYVDQMDIGTNGRETYSSTTGAFSYARHPSPPQYFDYDSYQDERQPKVIYRSSPEYDVVYGSSGRYTAAPAPPPPAPPSFHPRSKYFESSPSPSLSPPPVVRRRKSAADDTRPKLLSKISSRVVSKSKVMKAPKVIHRKVISKSSSSSSSLKKKDMLLKGVTKTIRMKPQKVKKLSSAGSRKNKSITISSETSSSGSSSSGSSSDSDSGSDTKFKAPKERVVPKPHKQVLDQEVLENIAVLQGKEPGYKSGPGPGVKNLQFIPNKTTRSLDQRFTAIELAR